MRLRKSLVIVVTLLTNYSSKLKTLRLTSTIFTRRFLFLPNGPRVLLAMSPTNLETTTVDMIGRMGHLRRKGSPLRDEVKGGDVVVSVRFLTGLTCLPGSWEC